MLWNIPVHCVGYAMIGLIKKLIDQQPDRIRLGGKAKQNKGERRVELRDICTHHQTNRTCGK